VQIHVFGFSNRKQFARAAYDEQNSLFRSNREYTSNILGNSCAQENIEIDLYNSVTMSLEKDQLLFLQ
jgi:hypothetical protein